MRKPQPYLLKKFLAEYDAKFPTIVTVEPSLLDRVIDALVSLVK